MRADNNPKRGRRLPSPSFCSKKKMPANRVQANREAPRRVLYPIIVAALLHGAPVLAQDAPDWQRDTLSGDWGGARSAWYERGLHLELSYKLDVAHVASGGQARGSRAVGLGEAKLAVDAEKLAGWSGASAYLHVFSHLGGQPNARLVGSAMGVTNAEVATNTVRVFHAWVQQSFLDERVSLLAGLYPIDSEFYVTDASAVFLHPSLGPGAELSASGQAGPSIYNTSAFGLRLRVQPDPAYYAMLAVTDGVPGLPSNPRGTHIRFQRGDGAMRIAEFGWRPAEAGHPDEPISPEKGVPAAPEQKAHEAFEPIAKLALGVWHYTPRFDDFVATDAAGAPLRRASRGAYLLAERTLYSKPGHPSQGLAGFVRYGRASADVNPIAYSASVGLRYKGLLPGRDDDVAGIAATRARASEKFSALSGGLDNSETVIEATYQMRVAPWLAMQPSVQRIYNPGFDPALRDAWVGQLRFEVAL